MEEQSSQLVSEHEVVDLLKLLKQKVKCNNKKNMTVKGKYPCQKVNFPFHFRSTRQMKPNTGTRRFSFRFLSFCYSLMGKGNVQTRPFIYTAETLFPFIAHHNNLLARAIFTATLSSTARLAITRYTIFHP